MPRHIPKRFRHHDLSPAFVFDAVQASPTPPTAREIAERCCALLGRSYDGERDRQGVTNALRQLKADGRVEVVGKERQHIGRRGRLGRLWGVVRPGGIDG